MLALDRSGSATNYLPSTILHFTFVQTLIENPLSCKEDEHGVGWVRGWILVAGNWEGRRIIAKCIIYWHWEIQNIGIAVKISVQSSM